MRQIIIFKTVFISSWISNITEFDSLSEVWQPELFLDTRAMLHQIVVIYSIGILCSDQLNCMLFLRCKKEKNAKQTNTSPPLKSSWSKRRREVSNMCLARWIYKFLVVDRKAPRLLCTSLRINQGEYSGEKHPILWFNSEIC